MTARILLFLSLSIALGCSGGDGTSGGERVETLSLESAPSAGLAGSVTAGDAAAPRNAMEPRQRMPGRGGASVDLGTQAGTAPETVVPTMIIRSGTAALEVDSLEVGIARVRRLAQSMGGFVANMSVQGGRERLREATLQLKLPAANFDRAVAGLNPLGRVESVAVTAEDVGEEFVDLTARAANSRRLEQRLVELLATRTGKLEDVLAVERELARVREEIERHEGRLRYLRTRAAVSTLVVTLREPSSLLAQDPGSNPLTDAFAQAWRNFVGFIAWFIAALGTLIPLAALLALALAAHRRLGGRGWRRSSGRDEPPPTRPDSPPE